MSDAVIGDLVALLDSSSPGGARQWIDSVARRAGEPAGTILGEFIQWVRASTGAPAATRAGDLAQGTGRARQPSQGAAIETPAPGGRSTSSAPAQLEATSVPTAEPIELTFDDDWTEEAEQDLLAGDAVPDDLGIDGGAEHDDIELDDDDGDSDDDADDSDDDGPLLTDEAIDDLLADDSVDLDDDWMEDKPAT